MQSPSPFDALDPARKQIAYEKASQRVREVKESVPQRLQELQAELLRRKRIAGLRSSFPSVFQQFLQRARYKGAHGGRGSSKSWTFAGMLLDKALAQKGLRWVCVREIQKSLEQSVKRLLEDLIEKHGLGSLFRVLNTHIETPGDGVIIFQGMQNHTAESIKSLEGYDGAWVEEAQSLSERSLTLLRPTIRKENSEIWFTWNPDQPTDPVDVFLRSVLPAPDSIVQEVNYHNNPYFPATLQAEMEWDQRRDPEKYQHIWLGGYERHSEARVFKNWTVDTFDSPSDAMYYYGADWGFSVDPSTLVRCRLEGRKLYVDYEAYQIGCEIDHLPALFDTVPGARDWPIRADSARPETISYLQRNGFPRMRPAIKGPNSIKEGVIFLQGYDIIVHQRCTHTIDELSLYSYKVDEKSGIVSPLLEDKKNHVIDPLRYATEELRAPGGGLTW